MSAPQRLSGNCVSEGVLPSGSWNQATRVPSEAVQMPRPSWGTPSKRAMLTPRAAFRRVSCVVDEFRWGELLFAPTIAL